MKTYSNCIKYLLLLGVMSVPLSAKIRWTADEWNEAGKFVRSVGGYHISIGINKLRFGKVFTFNPVLNGNCSAQKDDNKLCVCLSEAGRIMSMHDGKKIPLILGAIPRYKEHIDEIKKQANLTDKDKIGFYTFNRDFECSWLFSGLSELKKDVPNISHEYPTTDFGSPSFVDLLRAVRDLDSRDSREEKIAYVHCKAGRGRSATTVGAYLMHVCNKAGISADPKQIEEYLMAQRSVVSLNNEHRAMLAKFSQELKEAGNFTALYEKYKAAVEARDKELSKK